VNHANGSIPHRLQLAMKVLSTAAVLPPASLPKKVQLPPAHRDIAAGPLGGSVVDLPFAVFEEPRQRIPLIQRVPHRDEAAARLCAAVERRSSAEESIGRGARAGILRLSASLCSGVVSVCR
jgi:hypothetical protein